MIIKRFCLINCDQFDSDKSPDELSNIEFLREALRQGTAYTQEAFVYAFNVNDVSADTQFLRIIDVEL